VIPAGPALELILQAPDAPPYRTCGLRDCANAAQIFELRDSGDQRFYALRAAPGSGPEAIREIAPIRFANGARLTGYAMSGTEILLEWRLNGPVAADYQAFIHVLDVIGERLAQQDRAVWPGRYWRAGDLLYLWFDLAMPPGARTLYVGMYTIEGEQYRNAEVVDDQGVYIGQGAVIVLDRDQ
jgi:hypothetical protein